MSKDAKEERRDVFVVKKKWIIAGCCAVALLTAIAVTLGCVYGGAPSAAAGSITVVIDAGHGGVDGGTVGVKTGTRESELNLSVAKSLEQCFRAAGVNVVMTRTTEDGLYGLPTNGFKRRDMQKRKEIILEAKPDLVLSVHMNKCPIPSRRGAQVFYAKGAEKSKELAEVIQNTLNVGLESLRAYSALTGDYYMLNCSPYTSVIVECGFLSNAEDEAMLLDRAYQDRLAHCVFEGAMKYLAEHTAYLESLEKRV